MILPEFDPIAFRRKICGSIEILLYDLDEWLREYNESRSYSGKFCYGKTSMQRSRYSSVLAKEKMLQYNNDMPNQKKQYDKLSDDVVTYMTEVKQMMNVLSRSTPEAVGIPSLTLTETLKELKKLISLNSIMVLRHGHVCAEGWWTPYSPDIPHMLFSLSKSFTSSAIGILQGERGLDLQTPLYTFFPEAEKSITDPKMRAVTLRHLLTMSSGHDRCAMSFMEHAPDGDYVKSFLSSNLTYLPGERFVYNSGATYMLAAVVRKLTGENVREYLIPRLFDPLGITPGIWECCPHGTNLGGWGFYLKTEDIAKFGQLLLDGGRWNGEQLIPADYLQAATAKQIDNSMNDKPDWKLGYGYQFWRNRYGFRADGACGQYALVLPEYDMTIAVTAGLENMQNVMTVFWEHLLPGIRKETDTLPENPEALQLLKAELASLSIPLAQGDTARRGESACWKCGENDAGIRSISITFGKDDCTLLFFTGKGEEKIHAGFGFNCDNLIQFRDSLPRRAAASAAWTAEKILEIHVCNYETPFCDVYRVDFESEKVTRSSNTNFLHPPLGLS